MKITVIIPAYNAERYIARCLESVLTQSQHIDQIIVVNDGSTDRTKTILEKYTQKHSALKVINQQNAGVSAARNKGIIEAKSEWILLLDSDDECADGLLQAHVGRLNATTGINSTAMIYTAFQQIDAESKQVHQVFRGYAMTKSDGVCDIFLRNPIISPTGILLSREKAIEVGLFRTDLKCDEDVDLWIRLTEKYNIEYIDEALSLIRRHDNNTTRSMSTALNAEKELIKEYGISNIKKLFRSRERPDIENAIDLCTILIKLDLYRDCIEMLDQIKLNESDDKYKTFLFLSSICQIKINNIAHAKSYASKLLQINPTHGAALNNLGVLDAIEQNYDNAMTLFNTALSHYPNYMDAKHNLRVLEQECENSTAYKYTLRELRPVLMDYTEN